MNNHFYIASCVFTEETPKLSRKIQQYITSRYNIPIIRCCVASTMISLCHNCSAIFEERHPEINRLSLWELICADNKFVYPDFHGERIAVQDCWRSKENVRGLKLGGKKCFHLADILFNSDYQT